MKTNNNSHWILRGIAEEQVPRSTINLWPQVETRLNQRRKDSQRKTISRTFKTRFAFALAFVLLLIGSLAFVPGVRRFAEEIIQRMGIAFVDTDLTNQPGQMQELVVTVSTTLPPSPSLAEIQEQLSFRLLVPTWLPNGLNHIQRGISRYDPQSWEGSGVQVEISYNQTENFQSSNGMLLFEANDGPIGAPPLLAEGREQSVTVNGQSGYYVHGAWQNDGTGDPNTRYGDLLWDDQADDAYLTWTQEGVTYLLAANNLNLGLDDLTRIAESIKAP
jgi:hypothetical protein